MTKIKIPQNLKTLVDVVSFLLSKPTGYVIRYKSKNNFRVRVSRSRFQHYCCRCKNSVKNINSIKAEFPGGSTIYRICVDCWANQYLEDPEKLF